MIVLAIGPDDSVEDLRAMRDSLDLTLPVLHDEGGGVHTVYALDPAFTDVAYPQEYLLDRDGQVVYVSNTYEPEQLKAVIDELLGV